jgi:hypothetical protein
MRTFREGRAVRWNTQCRGGLHELDGGHAHQEQALSLAEEIGETGLQTHPRIAL